VTQSKPSTQNWVFLGDSLTEGVGSERVSHVTELVKQLRVDHNGSDPPLVHHLRLRAINPDSFDPFVRFNVAGYMNIDMQQPSADALWIWNLACEGRTIETDFEWLPLIASIRPQLVVIFRGSLESIIRPAMLRDGSWPMWVPRSWRSYSSMDPRCYFSTTSWRRVKQTTVDSLKQRVRRNLLRSRPGKPLMDLDSFVEHYDRLVTQLVGLNSRVLMLGLLPVGEQFPDSAAYFERVNGRLRDIAAIHGAEFCDWASQVKVKGDDKLFYRDTFHPNAVGAKTLAQILRPHLTNGVGE
jgi:lysophospholipase L1-like esterase